MRPRLAQQTGDHHSLGSALHSLGALARVAGDDGRAREQIGEWLGIMRGIRCNHCCVWFPGDLAVLADAAGDSERAVRLFGAADSLRERTGIAVPTFTVQAMEETQAEAKRRLGEAGYAAAWSEGRVMSLNRASAYACGLAAGKE